MIADSLHSSQTVTDVQGIRFARMCVQSYAGLPTGAVMLLRVHALHTLRRDTGLCMRSPNMRRMLYLCDRGIAVWGTLWRMSVNMEGSCARVHRTCVSLISWPRLQVSFDVPLHQTQGALRLDVDLQSAGGQDYAPLGNSLSFLNTLRHA